MHVQLERATLRVPGAPVLTHALDSIEFASVQLLGRVHHAIATSSQWLHGKQVHNSECTVVRESHL